MRISLFALIQVIFGARRQNRLHQRPKDSAIWAYDPDHIARRGTIQRPSLESLWSALIEHFDKPYALRPSRERGE